MSEMRQVIFMTYALDETSEIARMIEEGTTAPDFTVLTDEGKQVSLRDYRGHWVVLYFYPKADTPG